MTTRLERLEEIKAAAVQAADDAHDQRRQAQRQATILEAVRAGKLADIDPRDLERELVAAGWDWNAEVDDVD